DRIKALLIAKMNRATEKQVNFKIDNQSQMIPISNKQKINALITIISNLIDNSIEAVLNQGEPEINFYIGYFDGWMEIVVQDNGCGINNEENIFKKGYSTKNGGINRGYGLYNVTANVEFLEGYIDVNSRNGQTVFTVEIPIIEEGEHSNENSYS